MPRVFLSMPSISLAPVSATFSSSLVENLRRGKAASFLNLRPWCGGGGQGVVCAAMGTAEEFWEGWDKEKVTEKDKGWKERAGQEEKEKLERRSELRILPSLRMWEENES